MAIKVREPPERKYDGYIGVQMFERPDYHSFGTRIEECIIPFHMYLCIEKEMKKFFNPRRCEVYILLTRRAELIIWILVPDSHPPKTLHRYAKSFAEILRKLGLVMNPIFCPLRRQ